MAEPVTDPKSKALEFFKDWSNYLLVTTVAAVGWVAAGDIDFSSVWVRAICILAFALSITFGILTLALIPLVEEQRNETHASNYDVVVAYGLWKGFTGRCKLKALCFPQHVFFLLGIFVFAIGTMGGSPDDMSLDVQWFLGIAAFVLFVGAVLIVQQVWAVVGWPWARAEAP